MEIKFYTNEDIMQDIMEFEGVPVEITHEGSNPNKGLYSKKYSECYEQPLGAKLSIDTIRERIANFTRYNIFECLIPYMNKRPDPEDNYTIYTVDKYDKDLREIDNITITYHSGYKDQTSAEAACEEMNFSSFFVVLHKEKVVKFYTRKVLN